MTQQEYENKIKELQDELEKLKAAKIEAEQPKRWKPEYGERCWAVSNDGVVASDTVCETNDRFWYWFYLTGNCFKTRKEAEEYKMQIEYTARYKNYIEEHSEPLDWKDEDQRKYYPVFDYKCNKIDICCYCTFKCQGIIFATSEQIIWDAIKEIGKDNFKKYVLGVK